MKGSPGRHDRALQITGGVELQGDICVSGSKNAALPEMAAAFLTTEKVTLQNVPRVSDTALMAEILQLAGGHSVGDGKVEIDTRHASKSEVPDELGRRMRATIVLLGALLARFGHARVPRPGGDDIGARRVEQHLRGLRQMGAHIEESQEEIVARADRLRGERIVFDLPTVTGTENILLAAVTAEGRTEIFNAAREPHVQDLCRLLVKMGAHIDGIGTERLIVEGTKKLRGAEHTVIADYLEAGTYAIAVAAAGGDLRIECTRPEDLELLLLQLEQAGARVEAGENWFRVARDPHTALRPTDMSTWTFPGFPTDLQAQYMALMTQADGETVISEYVHENRFQHVRELAKMGAGITVEGRLHAIVHGPARLRGTELAIPDIRSGAALVIAALCADGESVLRNAWSVRIFVKGEGVVLNEPSATTGAGADSTQIIHNLIGKARGLPRLFKPEVVVSVRSSATSSQRRAVTEAAIAAGARQVWLIDEPLAAAMGAGLAIGEHRACAICEIGAGTTEVAVISRSGIVAVQSIAVGGRALDRAIAEQLGIGEQEAEALKIAIGSAIPMAEPLVTSVADLEVSSNDIAGAVARPLASIAAAIGTVLSETPVALAADVRERGIVLSGGGAQLRGLTEFLAHSTGVPVVVADDPQTSVVRGAGLALENFEVLKRNQSSVR